MQRRWLCKLCSTTDDGYAGCAEGIEPSDAMTTMTCLFVLACFCLPLSVKPFLCPLVCSSCFAHLLLRASDVEVTAVSACWPASVHPLPRYAQWSHALWPRGSSVLQRQVHATLNKDSTQLLLSVRGGQVGHEGDTARLGTRQPPPTCAGCLPDPMRPRLGAPLA